MSSNSVKIKRKKFLNYSFLTGAAAIILNNIPFISLFQKDSNKKIVVKSNPLSVSREKSGDKNV
mgnify:FL=1